MCGNGHMDWMDEMWEQKQQKNDDEMWNKKQACGNKAAYIIENVKKLLTMDVLVPNNDEDRSKIRYGNVNCGDSESLNC